ncbi:muscarinic acetylcholine receptor M2-like [Saccostrea cucullata]|uniref:muscarinic acetylcholine receptor M2-like n=1 Tax=Saccostrea cuccullata TaxID=36930 RepID=UPI002ED3811E
MVNISLNVDYSSEKQNVEAIKNTSVSQEYLLWMANEHLYHINIPTVVFYVVAIIVGIFGNSLVIYVFRFRFKRTTANIFIVCLAAFDTITCFMLIFEVFDKRLPMYSGNYPAICKLVRCLEVFANGGASIILVGIAFDRYYKICKPFKRLSMRSVRNLIIGTVIVMVLVSWPMVLFHGSEVVTTKYRDITGQDCADDDNFKGSVYPGIYFIILFIFIIACIGMIVVLYALIFVAILKWKHRIVGEDIRMGSLSDSIKTVSSCSQKQRRQTKEHVPNLREENPPFSITNTMFSKTCNHSCSGEICEDKTRQTCITQNEENENKMKELAVKKVDEVAIENDSCTAGIVNEGFTDSDEKTEEEVLPDLTKTVSSLTINNYTENNVSKTTISNEIVIENLGDEADTKPKQDYVINGSMSIEESKIKLKYKVKFLNFRSKLRRHGSKSDVRISATTVVFSLIALLYVLSYIPTIVVESINAIDPLIEENLSDNTRKVVVMANSAYFMNGAFNPLIYGLFNKAFRDELLLIVKGNPK